MRLHKFLTTLAACTALAGCAVTDQVGSGGPAAEAPLFRVGDRWSIA